MLFGSRTILIIVLFLGAHELCGLLPFNKFDGDISYGDQIKTVKKHMQDFKVEQISFASRENEFSNRMLTRKGFLMIRPQALGTVIFCHAYTHSKHESFFFKTFFPNFNALAFDFRAHGELAEGQYSTVGADEIYDVLAAANFIKNHPELKDKPIIGFGFSMGAVSLLRAQSRWPDLFDMLILDSPFDSGYECIGKGLDNLMKVTVWGKSYRIPGKSLIMKSLYNEKLSLFIKYLFKLMTGFDSNQTPTKFVHVAPIESAERIKVPCLFFACVKDNNVPVDSVKKLYQKVGSSFKRMWITQGIKHCSAYLTNPEVYWYRINKFVKKVLENDTKVKEKIVDDRVAITAL